MHTNPTSFEDCTIRVRYADTDQMGVVYYSNYLVYFEVGRTEFCRRRGIAYAEIERQTSSYLIVAEARCRYRRPLRYDQEFVVRTSLQELRKRTMTFAYQLLDPSTGTVFAEGETIHVVTDQEGRPKSFPEEYRARLVTPSEPRREPQAQDLSRREGVEEAGAENPKSRPTAGLAQQEDVSKKESPKGRIE